MTNKGNPILDCLVENGESDHDQLVRPTSSCGGSDLWSSKAKVLQKSVKDDGIQQQANA